MKNKVIVLVLVATALGGVIWMKTKGTDRTEEIANLEKVETVAEVGQRASVFLFADPREEDADCGCADIIKMARATKKLSGVTYQEIDSRNDSKESDLYKIRISPTVLIFDGQNKEISRFEGESKTVVEDLKRALDTLSTPTPNKSK